MKMTMQPSTARKTVSLSDNQWFALFIAPSVIILMLVIALPLLWGIFLSMTDYNLIEHVSSMPKFIGIENFRKLLAPGSDFWEPFFNTLIFTFFSVACPLLIGLGTAIILNQGLRGLHTFRALIMLPWILPTVVTAMLWLWILNPQYGILNFLLLETGIIKEPISWLMTVRSAMPIMVLIFTWKALPYYTVMLLSGLQLVSKELVDAATMDGANGLQRLWYVTLPTMRNGLMVVVLLGTIWGFQQFTIMWTTTKGGPLRATETLSIFIYREAFQGYDMGYAAAVGMVGLIFLMGFTLVFVRLVRRTD